MDERHPIGIWECEPTLIYRESLMSADMVQYAKMYQEANNGNPREGD